VFKQYQKIVLLEDLNPIILKGMTGVILEIWDEKNFEVEFIKEDGANYEYEGHGTFTVNSTMIR
jgi:hypothetical protein